MSAKLTPALALLRLILCLTGPVAIWLSWRWTATTADLAPFDGFLATSRALAGYGATAFAIACLIAALRLGGEGWIGRLARAVHASGCLILYLVMIGPVAHLIVPVLAILVTDIHDLIRPMHDDGLSSRARPAAGIGQALTLLAAGLPLLAAPLGWTGAEIALTGWIICLWLAAAFKLYRFMPRTASATPRD